jgi:hypothetical protein
MSPRTAGRAARAGASWIPIDAEAEWTSALDGVPHSIVHTWGYCRAIWLTSRRPTHLYVDETDGVRVVCPLAEREFAGARDVVTPYGFGGFVGTADAAGFPARWRASATRMGYVCGYVGLHPTLSRDAYAAPAELVFQKTVFVLDLTRSERDLLAALSENRRRQLRTLDPEAAGLVADREAAADFLVSEYAPFMDRKAAAPVYRFSRGTLRALCDLEGVVVVAACRTGRVEAAAMFGYTAHAGDYLFGVSLPGAEHHSTRLVWWGAMTLRQRGVPSLNLGGGVREGDRLAEFKRRFGGREIPFQALRQVFRPRQYAALCARAGVARDDATTYFPPYHGPR